MSLGDQCPAMGYYDPELVILAPNAEPQYFQGVRLTEDYAIEGSFGRLEIKYLGVCNNVVRTERHYAQCIRELMANIARHFPNKIWGRLRDLNVDWRPSSLKNGNAAKFWWPT